MEGQWALECYTSKYPRTSSSAQHVVSNLARSLLGSRRSRGERADLAISALVGGNGQVDAEDIPIITFEGKHAGYNWTATRLQVERWCDSVNGVQGQAGTSIWAIAAVGRYVKFWIYSNQLTQQNPANPNDPSRLVPVRWNANPPTLVVNWAGGTNYQNYRVNNTATNADAGLTYDFSQEAAHKIIAFMLEHPRGANVPHIAGGAGAVW